MPAKAHYYHTRDKSTGKYKIIDRGLHNGMVIALADFKEAATLIVIALNEYFKPKGKPSEPTSPAPREAILGDIHYVEPLGPDDPAVNGWNKLREFAGLFAPSGSKRSAGRPHRNGQNS